MRQKNKVFLISGAAASDLTGDKCAPNTVHWTYDTWALANGTGNAIVKTGGKSWFFLTADYAFGHALERDTAAVVEKNGGKVLGKVRHPFHGHRLLVLPAAGAGLQGARSSVSPMPAATPSTPSSRRPSSASSRAARTSPALLIFLTDIKALGLQTAQGLVFTEAWYWDMNDANRDFAKKFCGAQQGPLSRAWCRPASIPPSRTISRRSPTSKSDADGKAVVAKMKSMPTDDKLFGKGTIRADGRKIHPMYLFEVKKPAESKGPWDLYKLRATIPAEEAFRPLKEGGCSLVKG